MKKIALVIILINLLLLIKSCANVGSPTGGAKDTTSPQVKRIMPEQMTKNFNGNFIFIEYSEFVDASTLEKELIIIPKIEKYEIEKGTKSVKIKFKEPLEDNTTYQIFFGKGVKDVNEGNIANLKSLVFSTGNYIDSLSISGYTKYLTTNANINAFVGLYIANDTLDIKQDLPYYWMLSEEGKFSFNNLKEGKYDIFAFLDNNSNKRLDKNEAIAYHIQSINPKDTLSITLKLSPQNLDTLKLISSTDNKDFYQIKYSKNLYKAQISDNQLFKIDLDKILVFKGKEDSLISKITAIDSLGNSTVNELKIFNKFKPAKTKGFVRPISGKMIPGQKYVFLVDRKIEKTNYDSIQIISDGKRIDSSQLKFVNDSIYFYIPEYKDSLSVRFGKGSFISTFNDTLTAFNSIHPGFDESNYGIIEGKVVYEGNMILELYKNNKLEFTTRNKDFEARYLDPGDYTVKVIKDLDNNGYWTQGDYRIKKPAEEVYISPKVITLKANWELKDMLITVE